MWALGLAAAAAVLILSFLPWRASPAVLELVALDDSGYFAPSPAIPASWAERTESEQGSVARIPLLLAVHNAGGTAARPEQLELSLPRQFRLVLPDGRALPRQESPGHPLARYELSLSMSAVQPGRVPELLPGLDTIWVELATPSVYCILLPDSVPEFVPAPQLHVQALSRLQVFYSFRGGDLRDRQAGLLTLRIDPAVLQRDAPPPPPRFESEVIRPAVPLPPMSGLRFVGSRRSSCGPPEDPIEILSIAWESLEGTGFFVIDHGGKARKYLFDLDADGIVDLEVWDSEGTGRFNTRRSARFPLPEFVLPLQQTAPADFDRQRLADLAADSLARLDRFRGAAAFESRESAPASPETGQPRTDRFRPVAVDVPPEPPPARRQPRLLGTPVEGYELPRPRTPPN